MAVDDITTVITAGISAGASVTRQPSSGVEEMLLSMEQRVIEGTNPNRIPAMEVARTNGSVTDLVMVTGNTGDGAGTWFKGIKFVFDNTNYMNFTNHAGSTEELGFAVIQVG